jgi:hypothetical protein
VLGITDGNDFKDKMALIQQEKEVLEQDIQQQISLHE